MKFPFNPRVRAGIALLILGLVGLSFYLSTTKIELHITSRIVAVVFVLVILIVFVVLPVYTIIVTREIRKRRLVEEALAKREKWFSATLASVGDAGIATDMNGSVTFMRSEEHTSELQSQSNLVCR